MQRNRRKGFWAVGNALFIKFGFWFKKHNHFMKIYQAAYDLCTLLDVCYTSIKKSLYKRNKSNCYFEVHTIYLFIPSTIIYLPPGHCITLELESWLAVFYTLNPALTKNDFNMHVDKPPKSLPSLFDLTFVDLHIRSTVAIHSMSTLNLPLPRNY